MLGLIVKVSTFDDIGLVTVRKICTFPLDFKYSAALYWQKLESLGYIFVADSIDLASFKFSQWAPKDARVLKHSA